MLLSRIFINNSRSKLLTKALLKQLTPFSSQPFHLHHNFLQKCTVRKIEDSKTGLLENFQSLNTYQHNDHLRKFIHGQSALNSKKSDEKNIKNDEKDKEVVVDPIEVYKKLGLFARFKRMTKEYWYVLIPVHCITSCFWFGGFYYASVSGVDIIGILESWNFPEKLINPLRDSDHLGHLAVAYLCYKLATPARYTVTLGGTTFTIRQGMKRGLIKPMPTRDQLVQMYNDKTSEFKDKFSKKDD